MLGEPSRPPAPPEDAAFDSATEPLDAEEEEEEEPRVRITRFGRIGMAVDDDGMSDSATEPLLEESDADAGEPPEAPSFRRLCAVELPRMRARRLATSAPQPSAWARLTLWDPPGLQLLPGPGGGGGSLHAQWGVLYRGVTEPWLASLGREPGERLTCEWTGDGLPRVTLPAPLTALPPGVRTAAPLAADGSFWNALANQARVYYGVSHVHDDVPDASRRGPMIVAAHALARAQITAVTGDVYLLYDLDPAGGIRIRDAPLRRRPVTMVSIAGINVAYAPEDVMRFVVGRHRAIAHLREGAHRLAFRVTAAMMTKTPTQKVTRKQPNHLVNGGGPPEDIADAAAVGTAKPQLALDTDAYLRQMRRTWYVVLTAMHRAGVRYPVLSAIGCGAFRGPYSAVPALVALALLQVMRAHFPAVRSGERFAPQSETAAAEFDNVIVCFPGFPSDQLNWERFATVFFGSPDPADRVRVMLLPHHSMMHVASALADTGHRAGMLNPSDVVAVREGHMGTYWDGGHIALEELLAVGTTLLTMHRALNPPLWTDDTRWHAVDLSGVV